MNNNPKIKIKNIVVQEFESEILIYDLNINKAFCLNQTSAMIWSLCDGKHSIADIAKLLSQKLKEPITDDLIWLALDQFKRNNLLEDEQFEINFGGLNRRQIIKKIGFASLVTLPIIAAVIAPQAAQAASCVGLGQPCAGIGVGNCCDGSCDNGVCSGCPPGRC